MRFEVLGPLRVRAGSGEVAIRARRARVLLAMLLLHADRIVPVAQLVDALWPEGPPRSARNQVHTSVSQLRRRLSAAGLPDDVIATDPGGYRMRVDPQQVDVHRFRALVSEARADAAVGRHAEARDRYRAALALWHGPALAGIDSEEVRRAAVALDEEHVQAVEECVRAELALGGAGELVGELTDLVQRYPYREGLHAALMQALYRTGRVADALAAYRRARSLLLDELGTEPGEELQRLHQTILNRDPDLLAAPALRAPVTAVARVPRELPAEPSCFVGRDKEIARIRQVLASADHDTRGRPSVVVLYGPGGVGKSALAVRVAHELADEFPDGQLYIDLCGSTPGMRPLAAVEVLGRLLRSLGVHQGEIPSNEDEAAALFRSISARRRLLLVLDNAAAKSQVAPLLPASHTCAVLITSRHPQSSLDVDQRLRVDTLSTADALELLTGLTNGLHADAGVLQTILMLTGGLPLAIRIVGGRLASRPELSAAEYAARLADRSRRLDELQLDDLAVRASVRTSYDALQVRVDPREQLAARVFRTLGLIRVSDVAPGVVAASIADGDTEGVRVALDRLVDDQLVEPIAHGRYRLHDLVRLVAAERAEEEEPRTERDAVVARAIAYYAAAIWRADHRIRLSSTQPFGTPAISARMIVPEFVEPSQARKWIEEELSNLMAILRQGATSPDHHGRMLLWLGYALWSILDMRCAWPAAHELSRLVLDVGRKRGDDELTACGLLLHGRSEACLGNYDDAAECLERAWMLFAKLDSLSGVALALNGLGLVLSRQGQQEAALSHYRMALEIARERRLTSLTATVLNNMSMSYACLGDLGQAVGAAEASEAICSPDDLVARTARSINHAGALCLRGSYADAVRCADEAVGLSRETGDRRRECEALIIRCESNLRRGYLGHAYADAERACSLAEANRYGFALASALYQQGSILEAMGKGKEAARARVQANGALTQPGGPRPDPLISRLLEDRPAALV